MASDITRLSRMYKLSTRYGETIKFCTPSIPKKIINYLIDLLKKSPHLIEGSVSCDSNKYGNLGDNTGLYRLAQIDAANAYDVARSIYGVNGSTGNNRTILKYFKTKNKKHILSSRNIHKSIGIAAAEYNLDIDFLPINYDNENEFFLPNNAEDVRKALQKYEQKGNPIDVVLLCNPTYEGFSANIREISDVIQQYNEVRTDRKKVIFYVDEAWGAHLPFLPKDDSRLPRYSLHNGADINTISSHKNGGGLNQTAMIQVRSNLIDSTGLDSCSKQVHSEFFSSKELCELYRIHHEITTTSPSPFLITSMDLGIQYLSKGDGRESLDYMVNELAPITRKKLSDIKGITTIDESYISTHPSLTIDLTKIIFNTAKTGMSAEYVSRILLEDYRISVEKKEDNCAILLLTYDSDLKDICKLEKALHEITKSSKQEISLPSVAFPTKIDKVLAPYIVEEMDEICKESKKLNNSLIGRISAEDITLYPPGIPIIYKGELITKEHVDYLLNAQQRDVTKVARDKLLNKVYVLNKNGENHVK